MECLVEDSANHHQLYHSSNTLLIISKQDYYGSQMTVSSVQPSGSMTRNIVLKAMFFFTQHLYGELSVLTLPNFYLMCVS